MHGGAVLIDAVLRWLTVEHLNALAFFASVLGALLLHVIRQKNNRRTQTGQWLSDALGIGTLVILCVLIVSWLFPGIKVAEELAQENAYLISIAFCYCAVMIGVNLIKSVIRVPAGVTAEA